MLTNTKLRNLKPKDKLYKVNDRDGLYVDVTSAGSISFRYNYSIHGRQETITFGRYGVGGITLAEARERLGEPKKMIAAGKSPAKGTHNHDERPRTARARTVAGRDRGAPPGNEAVYRMGKNRVGTPERCEALACGEARPRSRARLLKSSWNDAYFIVLVANRRGAEAACNAGNERE